MRAELQDYVEEGSAEHAAVQAIDFARLPRHVAVIMDGNGRWAARREQPRVFGHAAGIDSVRETVEASARLGLEILTLFAFSRENWKRPAAEIATLMQLLEEYVASELPMLERWDIRLGVIGRLADLPERVRGVLRKGMEATRSHRRMVFNVALSYGGRTEIVDACNALLRQAGAGGPTEVTEEAFAEHLYTAGQPDPDLLIRTSGENRVSNFLLWQIAYAELWTTETLWPDFRRGDLFRAVLDYQRRERRYGAV